MPACRRSCAAGLVFAILVVLSSSFALASFGRYWWIVLPGATGYMLTVALGKKSHRLYRDKLRHGR